MKGALTSALLIGAASLVNGQTGSTTFSFSFYCGKSTVSEDDNIGVSLAMASDQVQIIMSGPGSDWFGIGFGSSTMDGTYAIIVEGDGSVMEYSLGDNVAGTELTSTIDVNGTQVVDDVRYILMSRALDVGGGDYYTFVEEDADISVIWATTSGSATYTGHTSYGTGTIDVDEIDLFAGGDVTQCTLVTGNFSTSATTTGSTGTGTGTTNTGGDDDVTTGTTGDDDDDTTGTGDDDDTTGTGDDDDDDDNTTGTADDDDDDDDDDAGSDAATHGAVLFGYMVASAYVFAQMA